jgi:hypothetical protein
MVAPPTSAVLAPPEGAVHPGSEQEEGHPGMATLRVPVVERRGTPLMPGTAPQARALLQAGKARPKRTKLGLFSRQRTADREPDTPRLVVGSDPGSSLEGLRVVGTPQTVCTLRMEAPTPLNKAAEPRRTLRRARRVRVWRRPGRCQNRLAGPQRLPPSTRSRWEGTARIVRHLATLLPLTGAAVAAGTAASRHASAGQGNTAFSPGQGGKAPRDRLRTAQGRILPLDTGSVTHPLREQYDRANTHQKDAPPSSSHAGDAWGLAAATGGAHAPTCTRLHPTAPDWGTSSRCSCSAARCSAARCSAYTPRKEVPQKGGRRQPSGGTRSCGFKRGTLVGHPQSGLWRIGGYDREKPRVSLRSYKATTRLTHGAHPAECHRLTRVALRPWLVPRTTSKTISKASREKGAALPLQA